jgi:hypothetical protein
MRHIRRARGLLDLYERTLSRIYEEAECGDTEAIKRMVAMLGLRPLDDDDRRRDKADRDNDEAALEDM